jgi:Zn-dependent peptidase ImmA (M78 family)
VSAAIYREAAARAAVERSRLGLGSEPIVDIRALVEQQGAMVYSTPIPGGSLSGCFALIDGDAWIMVNSAHSVGRQRFTVAHEYCHSLVHRDLAFVVCTSEKPPHEKYADAFAAAFLMPTDSVGAFFASDFRKGITAERVIDYCYAFGVSYQAAVFRLHNLAILSAPRRDALLEEAPLRVATAMGYDVRDATSPFFRSDERCGWSLDSLPRAYRSAALRAYDEELISESKLAELLGADADDLDELLDPVEVDEVQVAW